MGSHQIRLSIEGLEDRTTPASIGDLYAQTVVVSGFINRLADFDWMANPVFRPWLQNFATNVYQLGTDPLVGQMVQPFQGMAQANASFALSLGQWLGISVIPTVPPPGEADPFESVVTISPTTVQSGGTAVVTLTAYDADGRRVTTGGDVVTFGLGAGTGAGTFSSVTDNRNGTYTATFTGTTAGIRTITATLNGIPVFGTQPTVTVVAGPVDLARTNVVVAPPSLNVDGSTTVTLTARDAQGNALTTGGATVTFALGTGTAEGTFGSVTDNGNGTYTATFTGTTAGTNTIVATYNGQNVTSTPPTVTVVGPADLSESTVTVAQATIQSGKATLVTLTVRDANGNTKPSGGSTVVFGLGGGTADGTFSAVTDNGNGTYSATFTGTTLGTNTITATLDGQEITSTLPTITVVEPASPAESTIAVSSETIVLGSTITVTLTTRDASGDPVAAGGSVVAFALGGGTGNGTFSGVTDNGNGTYTATFTGTTVGTNTITATLDGQPVTTPAVAITVQTADAGMVNVMPDINDPNWVAQPNGLKIWDVVVGTGDPVVAGDSVSVFYTGWLAANGTQFDANRSPSQPVTFALNNLIQGWQQGVPGMQNGGIRRLYIPAALGYGASGSGSVPPNADLVFEIKLISHT